MLKTVVVQANLVNDRPGCYYNLWGGGIAIGNQPKGISPMSVKLVEMVLERAVELCVTREAKTTVEAVTQSIRHFLSDGARPIAQRRFAERLYDGLHPGEPNIFSGFVPSWNKFEGMR